MQPQLQVPWDCRDYKGLTDRISTLRELYHCTVVQYCSMHLYLIRPNNQVLYNACAWTGCVRLIYSRLHANKVLRNWQGIIKTKKFEICLPLKPLHLWIIQHCVRFFVLKDTDSCLKPVIFFFFFCRTQKVLFSIMSKLHCDCPPQKGKKVPCFPAVDTFCEAARFDLCISFLLVSNNIIVGKWWPMMTMTYYWVK